MREMIWLPLLLRGVASSSYGDCSCSCCAKVHPDLECTPQFVGHNTLSSCSSCSAGFCAHQWPTACPSGPRSGGKDNFGGHTSFQCDGWVDDAKPGVASSTTSTAEEGGGAGVVLLIFLCICCCVTRQRRQRYAPVAPVPMGQPVAQWPVAQPIAQQSMGMGMGMQPGVQPGAYYPPPPTVFVQPAQKRSSSSCSLGL